MFLNGVRASQVETLQDGDVIRIGSQDMLYYDTDETTSGAPTSNKVTTQPRLESSLLEDGNEATTIGVSPFAPGSGRLVSGLAVIGSVADKALALGRTAEAERILTRSLTEILERVQKADLAEPEAPERAAAYAIRLAAATGKGAWVDYVSGSTPRSPPSCRGGSSTSFTPRCGRSRVPTKPCCARTRRGSRNWRGLRPGGAVHPAAD